MRHCRLCGNRLWLPSSGAKRWLCARCASVVASDVAIRKRRISKSLLAIDMEVHRDDLPRHVETLVREGGKLVRYENLGIDTISPTPSRILEIAAALKASIAP